MLDMDFITDSLKTRPRLFGQSGQQPEPLEGFSIDSRTIGPRNCFVAIRGQKFDGHDFLQEAYHKGVRCFIAERRRQGSLKKVIRDGSVFVVRDTVQALAALASQYKKSLFSSVVALTGSSGKTTTRELIVNMLSRKYNVHTARKNFNNEIGLPLTILEAPVNTHIVVLEMGMNHAGEIRNLSGIARPLLGMITNIGYAHIAEFGSLDAIARVKAEIFQGIMPHGYALLNRDDPFFGLLRKMSPVDVMDFGVDDLKVLEDKSLEGYRLEYRNREFRFPLPGRHNLSNLAAAFRAADFFKVDTDDCVQAAQSSEPVTGRSEVIRKDITIINDCYNANPSSMLAGLELLSKSPGRRVAVLADMLELGKRSAELHEMVGDKIAEGKLADHVLAYGEYSERLAGAMKAKSAIPVFWYKTREELIDRLTGPDGVRRGDTVLVKASNGMKLDEAVRVLKSVF